ncbi:MAG: potassium transporter Kup [Gemmatimonadaceae bacterium]|nr:potassium transporter Kup [Gemmatimonadaceae bacterium]
MIDPQPSFPASPASCSPDTAADPVQSGSTAPPDPASAAPASPAVPQPPGVTNTTADFTAVANSNHHHVGDPATGKKLALLTLTALGVVYGDIGTSPLYALKECFNAVHGVEPTPANVIGVLSMIVWSLICVVSVKYIGFILRADNRGEGGILALLALLLQKTGGVLQDEKKKKRVIALALFGAALLYGDGIITPAVSVLGAVEGVTVIAPGLERVVVPVTIVLLLGLFGAQRFGTDRVGRAFGPIMLVWFVSIAALGIPHIVRRPEVLQSLLPWYAVSFMLSHGWHAFVLLGAVVLSVTGAEALYADMGHFGKRPIRLAWGLLVFPCLLMNYFGQGAAIMSDASVRANPFYSLAPSVLQIPLLLLATMAAIIASQALISGAFSLTQQSVQLGYTPRVTIVHTSEHQSGQIYIPEINTLLALGTIFVVLGFKSSSALAAAYGIAVTGTMAITTLLFYEICILRWKWPKWRALTLCGFFLLIDLAFLGANMLKVLQGGWVPLVVAMGLFILMTTWKRGREALGQLLRRSTLPTDLFLSDIKRKEPVRVAGTAVFMTSDADGIPPVLLHHLKHNKVLHEQVVLLSVVSLPVPYIDGSKRVDVATLGAGFWRVRANYGFMQTPEMRDIMTYARGSGLICSTGSTSYFLGREQLLPNGPARMSRWRKKLFILMVRNARSATAFFGIPPGRVVELGTQIEL